MVNTQNQISQTSDLDYIVNQPYKYGFTTSVESEQFPRGISQEIVKLISKKKNEPEYLLNFRLKAYEKWTKMKNPKWAHLKHPTIDFNNIIYAYGNNYMFTF